MPHSWPKSFNIGRMQISPITATSFHRLRKFTRARHMWLHLEPDWNLLWNQLYTEWPGIHTYDEINDRLFVNPGRNENILDVKSKVGRNSPEYKKSARKTDGPSSNSQTHGVQVTEIIRLLREQFVRCTLLNLKSWSSFDSKDYILRGSRIQTGNSSCGTPLQWRGIARGLLP